jgi:hypothetical protein
MTNRQDLTKWLVEALETNQGSASITEICKYIWEHYRKELRKSGNLFFTWQYDVRWAATKLRKKGIMRAANLSSKGIWELV